MLGPEKEKSARQAPAKDAAEFSQGPVEASCVQVKEVASGNDSPEADTQTASLPAATLRIEAKHPLAIRWMHWINFPVLATMIWSGLLIYWADSDHAYRFSHRVYRVGLGHWTLFRFFPPWFYARLHLTFQLANGMGYHFFFMWLFGINGILYVLYTVVSGEWRYLLPNKRSLREAWQVLLHDLHWSKTAPPQRKFNGAQQIAYTAVIFMGLGSLITGLAIYKPTQLGWITALLGGYEMARWLHFLLTLGYVVFFLVHVAQVVRAGWNNFRAMVTGYELIHVPAPEKE